MIQQEFIDKMTKVQEDGWKSAPRYGVYLNGKILYLSDVNVYKHKGVAKSKLKDYAKQWRWDPILQKSVDEGLSDEDFEDLFTQGIFEIKQIV